MFISLQVVIQITEQFKDNFPVYVLEKTSDDYTFIITFILLTWWPHYLWEMI